MNLIKDFSFDNFIGIYETRIDCQPFIDHFNYLKDNKCLFLDNPGQRQFRKDEQAYIHELCLPESSSVMSNYNKLTNDCLKLYLSEYNEFISLGKLQQPSLKIQKTEPTGGYHIFHSENLDFGNHNRVLVSMLYLNDVDEGGETEFLFLSKRFKPTAGTFLLFPAGFTHTHRGNPPLSGEKYIVTSWIEKKN